MKKWEQLQSTLSNSKSKEGQSNYEHKKQNLLKTVRVPFIECEFLWVLLRRDQ